MSEIRPVADDCADVSRIESLLETLQSSGKNYDLDKIKRAYLYAEKLHEGQFRNSGDPYICHPIAVAEIVASLGLDTDSVCAGFLHDTVEDCPDKTNLGLIRSYFGEEVAMLVDGLTKMENINIEDKEEAHMENIRKMLLAMSKDIRVIFIKLCDRLHNMRTLAAKREAKQRTTALETMNVYAPLAHRLGMQMMKHELENLALQYLDPIGYEEVNTNIAEKYGQTRDFLENVRSYIGEKLAEYNIHFTLEYRVKSVYSIYRKMFNHNKTFDEVYDFYALRIIVDTELECYTALGVIHELYKSVPGRFKDYISTPKPNMYQSLHTTVIGRAGVPFEVQIRTWDMHHIAEYGIAAHWKYKTGQDSKAEIDQKLSWISKLIDTENSAADPDEFMHALKIDLFHDETFVFTPKGDVISMPQGSTLIDFAYAIHSGVGNKMVGAKVNGMITPIDRVPQTGDIVEILTSASSKGPSRDWLGIVRTSEARSKIRQWFKKEKRAENIVVGKADIMREITRFGRQLTDSQKAEIALAASRRVGMQELDDLYNAIGYGGLSVSKILPKLRDEFDKYVKHLAETEPQIPTEAQQVKTVTHRRAHTGGIIIDGEYGCAVKFAKCCNPLPGDSVIGFVTKGFGVSVHKKDCPNVITGMQNEENRGRWKEARWDDTAENADSRAVFESGIVIEAENHIMLLAEITTALADMKVSLLSINTQKRSATGILIHLTVGCKNTDHFNSILARLRSIRNIDSVTRAIG